MSEFSTPHPLSSTLEQVAHHLPGSLVSPEALSALLAVCGSLPAALTHGIYLECRLSADPRVDMVIQVDERGRPILTGASPVVRLPRQLRAQPYWEGVRDLCVRWGHPTSSLATRARGMWLEFDAPVSGGEATIPLPGVFIKLAPPPFTESGHELEPVLESLPGISPGPEVLRALRKCMDELPPGAYATYLGSFAPRGTDAVRVCLAGLPGDALPGYLARVGWAGEPRTLTDLLQSVATADGKPLHAGPGMVHLDVADRVGPRIGLEYVLERGCQSRGRVRETEFLDRLVELGLCSAPKRDGLLAWPGYSFEDFAHELWPSLVLRRVNHVKLVYEEDHAPEAKGYLCAFSEFYAQRTSPPREEHQERAAAAAV